MVVFFYIPLHLPIISGTFQVGTRLVGKIQQLSMEKPIEFLLVLSSTVIILIFGTYFVGYNTSEKVKIIPQEEGKQFQHQQQQVIPHNQQIKMTKTDNFIIQLASHCYIYIRMDSIRTAIASSPLLQSLLPFLRYHLITEIVILAVVIVILVHYRGAKKNRAIAIKYQELLSPLIGKWFRKYDGELVYESPNIYKLYPSDRESCLFAIISFAMVPRQQIFSFLLNPIFFRLKDELVVEIPINNENPLSLTAAIVRRQQIRTITKKNFPDIKQLCKEYKPAPKPDQPNPSTPQKLNVPPTHCLLVQKSDHVRYFLYSEKQAQLWKTHGKSVKLVYISDVNKFSRYPMAVRMVVNLNSEDVGPMVEWLIAFVDRMAKAKMSIGEKKEAEKKRETLQISYQ